MEIRKGPDGIHFFDRVSGTNLLLDKLITPPATWSKSPRQVSIALTKYMRLGLSALLRTENKSDNYPDI